MGDPSASQQRITQVLSEAANRTLSGPEQLIEAFYPELKRLAAGKMRRQTPDHTLQPTALVNELYLELLKVSTLRSVKSRDPHDKSAFFALAAQVMHWLLVRHTRRLSWHAEMQELPECLADPSVGIQRLTELDRLLEELAVIDAKLRTVRRVASL